jgi:hypothetical protein
MRKVVFLLALSAVAALVGCASASNRASAKMVVVETPADYDRLWDACLKTVGERFLILRGEKDSGTIETAFLVGAPSMTGMAVNTATASDAVEDALHTVRRRALVIVNAKGESPYVVRVEKERLVRIAPDPVAGGKFVLSHKQEETKNVTLRWEADGQDPALEKVITAEIARAYRGS